MKIVVLISLCIFISACSSSPSNYSRRPVFYEDSTMGVRVIEKSEVWEPESNCKMVKYIQVHGENIQDRGRGYRETLRSLSLEARRYRGTVAQVRDFTNSILYAYIWFCSDDYS